MFSWSLFLGGIAYAIAGFIVNKVIKDYINELADEVAKIDERYVYSMFLTIGYKSERMRNIANSLLFIVWPVIDIAAILKAESVYDRVVKRNWMKRGVY